MTLASTCRWVLALACCLVVVSALGAQVLSQPPFPNDEDLKPVHTQFMQRSLPSSESGWGVVKVLLSGLAGAALIGGGLWRYSRK
jgi:hypothetical protein